MGNLSVMFACLVCLGHGRRMKNSVKQLQRSPCAESRVEALTTLLLASSPRCGFHASGQPGAQISSCALPSLCQMIRQSRFRCSFPACSMIVEDRNVKPSVPSSAPELDAINRQDFPILETEAYPGKPLIYLDSGASSQKPIQVLEAMDEYYRTSHANVHRGAHSLSIRATEAYEGARDKVKTFINAEKRDEIVFTQGATDALNIVAFGWGQKLQPGDEIILSVMEHHSNLVPWQLLAERTGAKLKFARLTEDEELDVDHLLSLMNPRTKIVSIVHVSNTLGCVNPIKKISQEAHKVGAVVVVDACQSIPHMPVDVQDLECDFLAASGHKMCGPTGIGFLYGKYDVLLEMPPVRGGGEMIDQVELETSTYLPPPARFEAGTPAVAEAIGLGAACEYLQSIGMDRIYEHEKILGNYLYERLNEIPGIRIYGPKGGMTGKFNRAALAAFNHDEVHATDLSVFLDQEGVAIRAGHHCTQPLHKIFEASGSARASCYFYNSKKDIDDFISTLESTITMFKEING